jgi:hypothetical protein
MSRLGLQKLLIKYLKKPNVFSPIVLVKRSLYFLPCKFTCNKNKHVNIWHNKESYYYVEHHDIDEIQYKNMLTGDIINIQQKIFGGIKVQMQFDIIGYPNLYASFETHGSDAYVLPFALKPHLIDLSKSCPRFNLLFNIGKVINVIKAFMNRKIVRETMKYLANRMNQQVITSESEGNPMPYIIQYNRYADENDLPLFDGELYNEPPSDQVYKFLHHYKPLYKPVDDDEDQDDNNIHCPQCGYTFVLD